MIFVRMTSQEAKLVDGKGKCVFTVGAMFSSILSANQDNIYLKNRFCKCSFHCFLWTNNLNTFSSFKIYILRGRERQREKKEGEREKYIHSSEKEKLCF